MISHLLLERISQEFMAGADAIALIATPAFVSQLRRHDSIGAHFRHVIEIAELVRQGNETGDFDYTARERDRRLENDRAVACERIRKLADYFRPTLFRPQFYAGRLRSEADPAFWHPTTITRELEYLLTHTIHHHAIIAERMFHAGIETPTTFGLAPSTLAFLAEAATKGETK
jgi:hypothetical protein